MTLGQVFSASLFSSLFTLFVAMPCHATVSNVAVSGASAYDNTTTPTTPVIFAGYTGTIGDCAASGSTLCDACTSNGATHLTNVCDTVSARTTALVTHCAGNSITPSTPLVITFTVDQIPATPQAYIKVGNSTAALTLVNSSPAIVAGSPITVQVLWSTICAAESTFGFGPDCKSSADPISTLASDTLTVYLSSDGGNTIAPGTSQAFSLRLRFANPYGDATLTPEAPSSGGGPGGSPYGATTPFLNGCAESTAGFCDFALGNGDSKVYVNNLARNSLGPNGGAIKWNEARLYYSEYTPPGGGATTTSGGFCAITDLANASYGRLLVTDKVNIGGSSVVATPRIGGLNNDQIYIFELATVDEASIVAGFLDQSEFMNIQACVNGAADGTCPFIGHPGQVIGLLDDQKCFIATAAWGSAMEPHVMLLRQFRNQFLLTNPLGTWFVHTYYRLSPPLAHWIAQHETARTVARAMLWPLVWMADAMIDHTKTYFSTPLYMAPSAPAKAAK